MPWFESRYPSLCGSSSVVERHLAKVEVAGSTPVFRSKNWRHSQVVRHGSATPLSPVQIRLPPPYPNLPAWRNWQTRGTQNPVPSRECRFDPDRRYHESACLPFPETLQLWVIIAGGFFCYASDYSAVFKLRILFYYGFVNSNKVSIIFSWNKLL